MDDFLDFVVRRMVTHSDEVSIDVDEQGDSVVYGVRVAPTDMGKVIGRKGATINVLRSLVQVGGAKRGQRCTVEILED